MPTAPALAALVGQHAWVVLGRYCSGAMDRGWSLLCGSHMLACACCRTECPVGFYAPDLGAEYCLPCLPGTISNTTGAAQCMPCPAGTFCLVGPVMSRNHTILVSQMLTAPTSRFHFQLWPLGLRPMSSRRNLV